MKTKELLIGRLYKCTYPLREGEYIYTGERLIGHCFQACDGNKNMAISAEMVRKHIHEIDD